MKIYIIIYIILFSLCHNISQAQIIHGNVRGIDGNKKEILLPGANVYWQESMQGTVTNEKGDFEIESPLKFPSRLIVSFIGYRTDTLLIVENRGHLKVELISELILEEFVLSQKRGTNFYSKVTPFQVQVLTTHELKKAACCNLSESFETNASVDVSFSDALTGAKQIELLGLAGIYTQMQFENIPSIRGLSAPYGMTYVPGPWLESIQISKGTSSVRNGFESITGQINYEYLKPDNSDKLFINLYENHIGNSELNVYSAQKLNDKISTMTFLHGNYFPFKIDNNSDDFMDLPLKKQFNIFHRWKYQNTNLMSQFGIGFLNENKESGQLSFNKKIDRGTTNSYGIGIDTRHLELFWKAGYVFPKNDNYSLAVFSSASFHEMKSFFGLKTYNAFQNSYYFNTILKNIIGGNEKHEVATGVSFISDDIRETLNDSNYFRENIVPGIFVEYTFKPSDKLTIIGGLRDDYHMEYGNLFTPRLHFRWMINERNILRASIGKGYRFPNVISENMFILPSSKNIYFNETPKMEEAWNYGLFYTFEFDILKKDFLLNVDFYRTDFINQVIIDHNVCSDYVHIYNLDGKSYANSFQAELTFEPINRLDVMIAYRLNDVKTTYLGVLSEKLMSKRSKGILNLSYSTKFEKWRFDFTFQYNGISRLPVVMIDDIAGPTEFSPSFFIINSQITKNFRRWELYAGVENLTNYIQKDPIIDYENPFGQNFETSRIWGPIFGRKFYTGVRFILR